MGNVLKIVATIFASGSVTECEAQANNASQELAKTGRSGCQNTECKKSGTKIEKGALRFGNLVDIQGNQNYMWKHWLGL